MASSDDPADAPSADHPGDIEPVPTLARAVRDVIVAGDHLRRILASQGGIGLSEFIVVSQLYFTGPCGPGTLTRGLGITAGSMTVLLDHLESIGIVTRSAHPTDRRRQIVSLTTKGSAYHRTAFGTFTDIVASAYRDHSNIDAEMVTRFLDGTAAALGSWAAEVG